MKQEEQIELIHEKIKVWKPQKIDVSKEYQLSVFIYELIKSELLEKDNKIQELEAEISRLKEKNVFLDANCKTHAKNLTKLLKSEAEVLRLKDKFKECWDEARAYEYSEQFGIVPNPISTFEEWSKENNI